jgi:glucose/arabinose dehydrogenase
MKRRGGLSSGRLGWGGLVIAALAAATSASACGDDAIVAESPDPRVTCLAPARPRGPERVRLDPAFPSVALDASVALVSPPGDARFGYLVVQSGMLARFDAGAGTAPATVVDLSDIVEYDGESGFLDVAFHPGFPEVPDAFFSIVVRRSGQLYSQIVRMTSLDGGASFDRASSTVVLEVEQPFTNHKGLYFGLGDGGGAGDPFGNAQNVDTLLGKMLRIDVDGAAPYAIPPDNPFAAGGGRGEIYAVGFRNPWRFSFDEVTGDLWVGDVGQNVWEEVDKVRRGGNYGWNVMEGLSCFEADRCDTAAYDPPVAQYLNTGGASVIGGLVLRGAEWGALEGTYFYSDFSYGTIFGLAPGGGAASTIGAGASGVVAWSRSPSGETYAVHYDGTIARLVAAAAVGPDTFPRRLSETGCVDLDRPREPVHGALPYDVAVPFWSDGADKARFVATSGGRATLGSDGDWDLPPGTVLVKSFFRGDAPIETRLLVRHDDGEWAGYGYAWRLDGSDADYVETSFEELREGSPWYFPATRDCDACHTSKAGRSLGLTTGQLAVGDQLARFADAGLIDAVPSGAPLPALGGTAPAAERARAYLDVNCSMCHQPYGPAGRAKLDLRYATPFADAGLCGEVPNGGDLDIEGALIVAPGDPEASILSLRLRALGDAHMPPIGITSVDEAGAAVVDEWIRSLAACP